MDNFRTGIVPAKGNRGGFSPDYVDEIFLTWFRAGRPVAAKLVEIIQPDTLTKIKPSNATLHSWITNNFSIRAGILDEQIQKELEKRLIQEKVEMLNRHAKLAQDYQDKAKKYLEDHWDELKPPAVIKLLLSSIQIERESRGIPVMMEKVVSLSDESLLEEARKLLNDSKAEIEPADVIDAEFEKEEITEG